MNANRNNKHIWERDATCLTVRIMISIKVHGKSTFNVIITLNRYNIENRRNREMEQYFSLILKSNEYAKYVTIKKNFYACYVSFKMV